jgi:hypothetical protein
VLPTSVSTDSLGGGGGYLLSGGGGLSEGGGGGYLLSGGGGVSELVKVAAGTSLPPLSGATIANNNGNIAWHRHRSRQLGGGTRLDLTGGWWKHL